MKCPICKRYFKYKKDVISHMDDKHPGDIPPNMSTSKYYYALNHGGETTGSCRICNNDTQFDEKTGRVKVLCDNPKCKEQFAKIARERNIKKYGVPHLLNNQDHQMYMLSRRKISGEYTWSDGKTRVPYVGSYERRFLEFLDNFLDFDPATIHAPCPISIYYDYDDQTLTHTPDFYIDILDLIVEIKHGGKNPNTHYKFQEVDIKKDKAKEEAIRANLSHNYIKVVDNDFKPFLSLLFKLTEDRHYEKKQRMFILNESIEEGTMTEKNDACLFDRERLLKYLSNTYIYIFGSRNDNTWDDMIIAVSTSDKFKDLIIYDEPVFRFLTDEEISRLKSSFLACYKYVGDISLNGHMRDLISMVYGEAHMDALSPINAFSKVLNILFNGEEKYDILSILLNTNLSKIDMKGV